MDRGLPLLYFYSSAVINVLQLVFEKSIFFLKNLSPKIKLELHPRQVRSRRYPRNFLTFAENYLKVFFRGKKIANFSTNTNFCEESA